MNYDVDYFIRKFEAIPEEMWCCHSYSNGDRYCALGHCLITKCGELELRSLFINAGHTVVSVNDGHDKHYPEPTPRQRILAALYNIKRMQQPQTPKREKVKPEIASDLLTFPIQERLDTILSQIKSS